MVCCNEGVCCCGAARAHKRTAVYSTWVWPAHRWLAGGHLWQWCSYSGPEVSSVLLHNVVRSEGPISIGKCAPIHASLCCLNFRLPPVEEILTRMQTEMLMKIYKLPTFSLTLELLTMLMLSTGQLLKVSPVICPSFETKSYLFSLQGDTPDILSVVEHTTKEPILFWTTPIACHADPIHNSQEWQGSCSGCQDDGSSTDRKHVWHPIHTRGPFDEANTEAMDAKPGLLSATDNVGTDVKDDVGLWGCTWRDDSWWQQESSTSTPCVLHPFSSPFLPAWNRWSG